MKRFLLRIFLFFLPIVLVLSVPVYTLWSSGEFFCRLERVAFNQQLVGYAYNSTNYQKIKWYRTSKDEAFQIVVLGSSRTLMFEEKMFSKRFYNNGYTIRKLNDVITFLESVPVDKLPENIILGLDQWMFNSAWSDGTADMNASDYKEGFKVIPNVQDIVNVYRDLYFGKYKLNLINHHPGYLGLNAQVNGMGLRSDGSMNYGNSPIDDDGFKSGFSKTLRYIRGGNSRFKYGDSVDEEAYTSVLEILSFCRMNDIVLVAFLPPFPNSVVTELKSGNHQYIWEIHDVLRPLFDLYGYEIFDFTDTSKLGSYDENFIDGFHGGTETYQRILSEIKNSSTEFSRLIN